MPGFVGAEDVVIILSGAPYHGWVDVTVTQSFDKAAGDAKITITEQPQDPFPARIGDPVVILMAGQPVLTGMVYEIDGTHDIKSHPITLTCRDKTQDLVDSTLGPKHENKPPTTLADVCRKTIGKMGIPIGLIDKIGPPPFGEGEVPVGDIAQTGHSYLDNWAQNRQCVLNTDGKGNLVIDRNMGRMGPGMLYKSRNRDDPLNNVQLARYKNSLRDRHNQTAASSQQSPNDLAYEGKGKGYGPAQAKPTSKRWGVHSDTSVPASRRKHFRTRSGLTGDSPKKKARWRSSVAKARGFQYVGTVAGFEAAPGALWWHGVLVAVHDEHFRLSDTLFVTEVRFRKDIKSGATTEVVCTYKDAFSDKGAGGGGGRGSEPGMGTQTDDFGEADDSDLMD